MAATSIWAAIPANAEEVGVGVGVGTAGPRAIVSSHRGVILNASPKAKLLSPETTATSLPP